MFRDVSERRELEEVLDLNEHGRGSSFKVCLPLVDEPAEAPLPRRALAPVEAPPRGGSERVLVVEDEEVVRSLVCEILEREGYDVVAASCGECRATATSQSFARVCPTARRPFLQKPFAAAELLGKVRAALDA